MNISRARFGLSINYYANYFSRDKRAAGYRRGGAVYRQRGICMQGGTRRSPPEQGRAENRVAVNSGDFYISHFPREKFSGCDANGASAITRRLAFRYGGNIYAASSAAGARGAETRINSSPTMPGSRPTDRPTL